jgi:hypothetical protein
MNKQRNITFLSLAQKLEVPHAFRLNTGNSMNCTRRRRPSLNGISRTNTGYSALY